MSKRGTLPVKQWRGRIRSQLVNLLHYLTTTENYNFAHPTTPLYTPAEFATEQAFRAIVAQKIAAKVLV